MEGWKGGRIAYFNLLFFQPPSLSVFLSLAPHPETEDWKDGRTFYLLPAFAYSIR